MCVRTCVHAWVTQFSVKLLQLHIFGKLLVLMNFYTPQNFFGLVNFVSTGIFSDEHSADSEHGHRRVQPLRGRDVYESPVCSPCLCGPQEIL